MQSPAAAEFRLLESEYNALQTQKKETALSDTSPDKTEFKQLLLQENRLRHQARQMISKHTTLEANDADYIFISFILKHLPTGIIGLLLAMIFSAAMSSTASELNALSATTLVDLYKRHREGHTAKHYVKAAQLFTFIWGIIAILFALYGTLFENLIQLVNIIGSIFYGTILGIFLIAFFLRRYKAKQFFGSSLFGSHHYWNLLE